MKSGWAYGTSGGVGVAAVSLAFVFASPAAAEQPIVFHLDYSVDAVGGIANTPNGVGVLDDLHLTTALDLQRLLGWNGASVFVHLLNNSGDAPNDTIGVLQGVDNIEVGRQRARLYEFWVEQELGDSSIRAGLYDLNSEFYATESSGLLLAPAFGIGSEIAATGPNGPSIFPSTALAVRVAVPIAERGTLKLAALNANAGVVGDPDGVDTSLDEGALLIGELNWRSAFQIGIGAWGYTERQADLRDVDLLGDPVRRRAYGFYITAERALFDVAEGERQATAFVRLGASEGDTTAYAGGWQAGVLVDHVIGSRPSSALSIGVDQGVLSNKYRHAGLGAPYAARAETQFEITYADTLCGLTVQPDFQIISNPGGDRARDPALVGAVRFSISL